MLTSHKPEFQTNKKKETKVPRTQHSRIINNSHDQKNNYTVLDNPDDRITEEAGDGDTIVTNDNPDDMEDRNC
ncbi:MAG: hypothetical protein CVU89_07905 [Firmicutes bacterium HGW-Firmicutes-14]|jgi:uncharacterized protein YaiI (UPF0178 family)|nr:MAG: hypothetical protein CVU89_07905 [Firmicutes bacterium HGW-Firmicutes-14]